MAEERSWRAMREHWQKYGDQKVHASHDFRRKGWLERLKGFFKGLFKR